MNSQHKQKMIGLNIKSPQELFDEIGRKQLAGEMESNHRPRVMQAFALIPSMNGNFLEIGVGNGFAIKEIAANQFAGGRCIGLDLSFEMVKLTRRKTAHLKNVTIEQGDFLQWRPPDNLLFSIIFSMETFEYFSGIQAGINKACSLLEPGGQLWVLVNYYRENEWSHIWPEILRTPMQLWSKEDYYNGFMKAGFTEIRQLCFYHPGEHEEFASDKGTLCTYGTKQI